jgi:hypothetical protein
MIAQGLGRVALAEKLSIPQLEEALENRSLPAYIGVPILEEKVQMRERMMMAQAGMTPPPQMSIEDEVIQRANQLKAPQMPQAPQEPQGIDQLPISMPDYAGGGIVAFEDGGEVSRFQNQGQVLPMQARLRLREMMNPQEQMVFDQTGTIPDRLRGNIAQVMPPQTDLRAPVEMRDGRPVPIGPQGEELGIAPPMEEPQGGVGQSNISDLLGRTEQLYGSLYGTQQPQAVAEKGEYLTKAEDFFKQAGVDLNLASKQAEEIARQKADLEGDRREAKKFGVISAALAILGGESANAFENIGKGGEKGFEKYTGAIKDIQKTEREMQALERSLQVAQNQARMGVATVAAGDYQAAQKRYDDLTKEMRSNKADLAKAIMADDRARQIVAAQTSGGNLQETYKIALAKLASEGKDPKNPAVQFEARQMAYGLQGSAQLAGQEATDYRKAADLVDGRLTKLSTPQSREYSRISREQGPEAAEAYKQRLIAAELRNLGRSPQSETPAPAGQQRVIDFGSIR